ncbi:cyclin-dependent kinase 11B-like [Amphibalanus amphitrite]|uniref:cyclin-dependent kinase 11B-like n=1 Tax=Amphibalanus amphitrite TaxID=1232801 RepID=UPI001C905744|nr:cyclin-dependent kinase 11B-like [Amphibalanus amphitrite]
MSDGSEDGEISETREFLVDDDSLDIKPPQNQAGSKHKSRSKHSSDHKRRDKHKHRRHESRERRRQRREHRDRERREQRDARREAAESHRPPVDPYRAHPDDFRLPSAAHRPPADPYDAHEPPRPSRSRDRRDRDGRRERRAEREALQAELREPRDSRGSHRDPSHDLTSRERDRDRHRADRQERGERQERVERLHERPERQERVDRPERQERPERRDPPTEVDLRSERLLQAVRVSEKQKEMSKRELEARRQRRELERIRQREERDIEAKREREREHGDDREESRRKRQRAAETREESKDREAERPPREGRESRSQKERPREESEQESSEEEVEEEEEDAEESEDSSSSSEESDDEEGEREEGEEEEGAASRSPTPTGRWRQMSRSSPEAASPRRAGSPEASPGRSPPPEPLTPSPPVSPVVTKEVLPPYLPAIQGCRNVEEFNCLNRIEEGTYGVVYRAIDKRTKEIVALKRLKMENEKEGFPITSLREINTLLKAQHENIVTVREIVVGSNMDKIYIVMDYVEHDLKSLMQTMKSKKQSFTTGEVKCLLIQMLRAVRHLHDNWILHRDLKTSNLLLSHKGILKVGDFGLAREYGSPLKQYTPIVVTLWYRAPELLLGCKEYSCPIDMWSVGCIFAELVRMEPMFPGKSEADQINRIFKELGTPNEKIWPGYSELPAIKKMTFSEYPYNQLANHLAGACTEKGVSLMNKLLTYDPKRRLTADEALAHSYFDEQPRPIEPGMFPTWPAKSEMGHKKTTSSSPKPPSGRKNLGDDDMGFQIGAAAGAGGFSLKF